LRFKRRVMLEFIRTRNQLNAYFNSLKDIGFFHPEESLSTGIIINGNTVLLYVRSSLVKSNLLEIEAKTLNECLNFLKEEIKWELKSK